MQKNRSLLPILAISALALAACVSCAASTSTSEVDAPQLDVQDEPYVWVLNYSEDMQLPELPTGCEATAASTMMRMNGILVSKTMVADRMPKSDTDFVHSFLGDPYLYDGWATSAPCITSTINSFLDVEEEYAAVEMTGTALAELPLPCVVWTTIDMVDPGAAVREQEGYGLFRNSHCVVVRRIEDGRVHLIDPLAADVDRDFDEFEAIYNAMGRQSVYLTDINTAVRMIAERGPEQ